MNNTKLFNICTFMKKRIIETFSQWKQNPIILRVFSGLGLLLFVISVLSTILITIFSKVTFLSWNLSHLGFENILDIYDFPLKSFAAFLALFTIYVTLKRTRAAEQQIELTNKQIMLNVEQNRISNYFKYRDEFVKHFEVGNFHKYYRSYINEDTAAGVYNPLFNKLYGSIRDFNHEIKAYILEDIQLLFSEANDFTLIKKKKTQLPNEPHELIDFLYNKTNSWENNIRFGYFNVTYQLALKFVHNAENIKEKVIEFGEDPLVDMMELYFNIQFLIELKVFAGIETKSAGKLIASIGYILHLLDTKTPLSLIAVKS